MSAGAIASATWCVEICSPLEKKNRKNVSVFWLKGAFKSDCEADSGAVICDSGLHK